MALACCARDSVSSRDDQLAEPGYNDMVAQAGFSQFSVPDGDFVDFYYGEEVLRQYLSTGDFVPGPDVDYSLFHLPRFMVDAAQGTGAVVTWSLCDAQSGIRVFHQVAGPMWQASVGELRNCTPWVQHYDGRMTIEYQAGQEGVYGFAQVYVYPPEQLAFDAANSMLSAGVTVQAAMPSACGDETDLVRSSLSLGVRLPDDEADDPLLADCVRPTSPEDGR